MSSMTQAQPAQRTNSDISERAQSLAREIDRLPPGFSYTIQIVKNELEAVDWKIEIVRNEFLRRMSLRNKEYSPE